MKTKMRLLSLLLCFVMLVGLLPTTAFALEEEEKEVIASVSATITLPKAGAHPVKTGTPGDSLYTIAYADFYDYDTIIRLNESDTFEAGKTYRVFVAFRPIIGYTIDQTTTVATINGMNAEYWTSIGSGADRSFSFWLKYTVPEEITSISVTAPVPVAGQTASADGVALSPAALSVSSAAWYGFKQGVGLAPVNKFAAGETYSLIINYDVAEGYAVSAGAEISHNLGGGETVHNASNKTIAIEYTVAAEAPKTYTVTFDANGGSGTMAPVTGVSGEYTLPACTFTPPAGKQFKCWGVGPAVEEYDPGDTRIVTADTNIKALWEEITSAKTAVYNIVATSPDLDSIVTLYGLLNVPEFVVTQGAPAYINASTSNLTWQKKVDGEWVNQYSGRFTPGEWRISSSLRIDTPDAYQYELGNPTTLKVNGVEWTVENGGKPSVHPDYSYAGIHSPVFTVVDDPNVQPPVSVPSVHMVLKGYEKGALISAAGVETDAMVDAEVLGFLKLVDSNEDGVPEPEVADADDVFEEGVLYAVAVSLRAKAGYDISSLTPATVSLDRSMIDSVEEFVEEEETFNGLYILGDMTQYTVTFETNGGSAISPVQVAKGLKVSPPADPTRAYYAFAGWYSDSELTQAFDFDTLIEAELTLYAKWTPSPVDGMFLMTIDFNGGTSSMPSSGEVPANMVINFSTSIGDAVTPPSGKVLACYEIDGVQYYDGDEYTVTQNFTLKLLWKDQDANAKKYTVDFDSNGGSEVAPQTVEEGGKVTKPADPTKEGFDFVGWTYTEKDWNFDNTVNGDMTLVAVWKEKEGTPPGGDQNPVYGITVNNGAAYADAGAEISGAEEGTKVTIKANEAPEGKEFDKWVVNNGAVTLADATKAETTFDMPGERVEVTAAYKDKIVTPPAGDGSGGNTTKPEEPTKPADTPSESPRTGDNSSLVLWIALLGVSGFGFATTAFVLGKKKFFVK